MQPAPPPQPAGVSPEVYQRTYDTTAGMIKDTVSKIDMAEASYQDWLTGVDAKGKESAMFATLTKRHEEILAAFAAAKTKLEAMTAEFEANKADPSVEANTKLANDGMSLNAEANKILNDLHGLKSYQQQIKR
ncbi:hypothetical protein [Nannocystis sp. SCPEA4]|uniref:hypothetical protein n=1 Tax=Nannocystis sp. SCPEA4 TaxID=2996787 RepID=UPI00226DDA57|nr:hypothetical protein [Nannocystis sp. SCPEA4]MCY1058213.1 hypothetical protein [Nannocystis sp. SCPEA4]